jgi:hypothetical protein
MAPIPKTVPLRILSSAAARPSPPQMIPLTVVSRISNVRHRSTVDDYKESRETNTITVIRDEYSKSGGDYYTAEQTKASFGTDTDPQSQMETAGKGTTVNPLEISPANTEISKHRDGQEGQPESGVEKLDTSKKSSPNKGQTVTQYQEQKITTQQRMR